MALTERPRRRSAYLVLTLFVLLAGDAWRYTIGWYAYGVLAVALAGVAVWMLVAYRDRWRCAALPYPLIAFLGLATISIAWSFYPGATAIGLTATYLTAIVGLGLAVSYSWAEILRGLAAALRFIIGLSILFELFVSLVIRGPILPLVPSPGIDYSALPDTVPLMLFWSRNELFQIFDGGKIQGVTGNSVLLSYVALVGIIVFALQLAGRTTKRRWSILWLALSVLTLGATRSATIIAALAAVIIVAAAALAVRRAHTPRARTTAYLVIAGAVIAAATLAMALQRELFALLGKSEDLTGRLEIWDKVIGLAQQRPVFGWGWVSHWIPGFAPFDDLVIRNGVRQLHAHNAWIDMWLQLGIVGVIVFGALVLTTYQRSWSFAVDRPQHIPGKPGLYELPALLPMLMLTGLLIQSIAESRLLVEFGFAFLVLAAVKTKIPDAAARAPLQR